MYTHTHTHTHTHTRCKPWQHKANTRAEQMQATAAAASATTAGDRLPSIHTPTQGVTYQRLITSVGTVLGTASPHMRSTRAEPNAGAVRGRRNGHTPRSILSFGFTPEIKGLMDGRVHVRKGTGSGTGFAVKHEPLLWNGNKTTERWAPEKWSETHFCYPNSTEQRKPFQLLFDTERSRTVSQIHTRWCGCGHHQWPWRLCGSVRPRDQAQTWYQFPPKLPKLWEHSIGKVGMCKDAN